MIEINELSIKVKIEDNADRGSGAQVEFPRNRNQRNDESINEILEQVSRILKNKKER